MAGIRLRNDFLAGWALVIGAAGIFEASVGISRLVVPAAGLAQWQHYATCLLLGVLTVLAGIVARTRETREVKMARLAGS